MRAATAWLAAREAGREVLVVGATIDAAGEAIRGVALARGSAFGMHRFTLGRLAAELAKHELVERDLAAVGGLPIEALCARVVQRMRRDGTLGRFEVVSTQPGLPLRLDPGICRRRVHSRPECPADMALPPKRRRPSYRRRNLRSAILLPRHDLRLLDRYDQMT